MSLPGQTGGHTIDPDSMADISCCKAASQACVVGTRHKNADVWYVHLQMRALLLTSRFPCDDEARGDLPEESLASESAKQTEPPQSLSNNKIHISMSNMYRESDEWRVRCQNFILPSTPALAAPIASKWGTPISPTAADVRTIEPPPFCCIACMQR